MAILNPARELMEVILKGWDGDPARLRPEKGWLRAAREARGLSQREAAKRAKVSQQAFDQFESGEVNATITLARLQSAADVLDCDLVYYLMPRGEKAKAKVKGDKATGTTKSKTGSKAVPSAAQPGAAPVWESEPDLPVNLL